MLVKEWFSAAELAALALPGLPATKPNVLAYADRCGWLAPDKRDDQWRTRKGRGGGVEFHYSLLPEAARLKLVLQHQQVAETADRQAGMTREELSAWFARQPDAKKQIAYDRASALDVVQDLVTSGMRKGDAMKAVAAERGIGVSTLYLWEGWTHGVARCDRAAYLASRHTGTVSRTDCASDAWEFLKADYLRLERPNFSDCYRRLERAAKERGWTIPSARTLQRRIEELPEGMRVLAREGVEALKRLYPAQRRDRGVFHALEAVNADGHKWDVFVRWPDGYVGRPVMVAFQDLYSGAILSWRVDRSENKEAVRLAFGDLIEAFGIPDYCWLDNGRNFASKWLTGGTRNRYRFKIKDDEPVGIMTQLGVQVHWTTPYAGQSKPIERAFRDFAGGTAKHPRFAGAWTGNNPMAKPENYASTAVPLDVFLATLDEEIAAHNARPARKSAVCAGQRSFHEAFTDSYQQSLIRKATAEQRRLWLLAAEALTASRTNGEIAIEGNRFWGEFLTGHRGQKLTVRFDPQALHAAVYVYRLDGAYLGTAQCIEAAGFADVDAAREHARRRGDYMKAQRALLKAELSLSMRDVAAMLAPPDTPAAAPETKVVRLLHGNAALQPIPTTDDEENPREAAMLDAVARMNAARRGGAHLRVVEEEAGD